MMDRDQFATRILDTAHGDLKVKRGEIARVLRALGLDESYLRSVRRPGHRGGVKLETLGGLLEEAGLDPGAFFARAFPEGQRPSVRFRDEARRLEARVQIPATLAAVRARHTAGKLDDAATDVSRQEIRAIDVLRQTDPKRSGRQAAAFVRRTRERPAVARALGVWASALRVRNHHRLAAVVLGDALDLAQGYRPIVARLIQRAAYITSDHARFQEAATLAEEALVMHVVGGDDVSIGRTLVDMGKYLARCGESKAAVEALERGLTLLPTQEEYSRFAGHQCLGLLFVERGDLDRAEDCASKAAPLVPEGLEAGRLWWLRARIAEEKKDDETATTYLGRALPCLAESPGDTALVSAELVLAYLRMGALERAVRRAEATAPLIMRTDNEILQAAVSKLVWACQRGDLTTSLVERVVGAIEKEVGVRIPRPRRDGS